MDAVLLLIPVALCGSCCFVLIVAYYYYIYYYLPALKKQKGKKTKTSTTISTTSTTSNTPTQAPVAYEIPEGTKTDCAPYKRGVVGWENSDRSGKSYMWCASDDGVKSQGLGFKHLGNDKLSFLSVPIGMRATIYENVSQNGLVKTFDAGEWNLHEIKFENGHKLFDRASSIKIEGVPVAAAAAENGAYVSGLR